MEKSSSFKFCYHEIPFSKDETANSKPFTLVGIIDASGSMGKLWKQLVVQWNTLLEENRGNKIFTITFDTKARANLNDPTLKTLLNKHGGGGTTLDEPFLKFQDVWREKIPADHDIKVIFISDGQDNEQNTLDSRLSKLKRVNDNQQVTFMCLGILAEFPTFVSMKLREIYHNGDPTCPSVFLIEYLSEKALFNKFQSLRTFLRSRKMVKVEPSQILIPWESCVDEMPEGTKFCSEDDRIILPNEEVVLEFDSKKITSYNISDLFRNWTLRLQLDILNSKVDKKRAEEYGMSSLNLMKEMVEDYKGVTGIDLLSENEAKDGVNFLNRVQANQSRYERLKIQGFIETMRKISTGQMISNEDEYEAAKQLGLGTIIGKHKQKIFALKTMNTQAYAAVIQDFLKVSKKLIISEGVPGDRSFNILESQRDIFLDTTLCDGVQLIEDPYTMVECFPLVGQCLEVKRGIECANDIWKISVKCIPKIHSIGDSMVIVRNNNMAVLSAGEGKPAEKINCILPLFGKEDKDMTGLINSRLFQHLVGFSFTEQIDGINPEAYFAALTSLFMYIVTNEQTDYEIKLLEKIFCTLDILYQDQGGYVKFYLDSLSFNVDLATSPFHDSLNKNGYKSLSQCLLGVYFLLKKKSIDEEEAEEIMQRIFVEYFSDRVKKEKLSAFFTFGEVEKNLDNVLKEFEGVKILSKFFTLKRLRKFLSGDLKKEFDKLISKEGQKKASLILNTSNLGSDRKETMSYEKLVAVSKFMGLSVTSHKHLFGYLVHSSKNPQEVIRQRELVSFDFDENTNYVKQNIESVTEANVSNKVIHQIKLKLPEIYLEAYRDAHFEILPLSQDKLRSECKRLCIQASSLKYDPSSGFVSNACLAPKCPHYLQAHGPIRNHMSGWQGEIPHRFHAIVKSKMNSPVDDIIKVLSAHNKSPPDSGKLYGFEKDRVVKYIQLVIQAYREMGS